MESQKYQGSYSACPTPRFKSCSTNLKDLLFAWWKEFCGRESRDSSVAYQQPDPGQGSHLTSLHFRLFAGETGKLTRDANLHERYDANESHQIRDHGTGLRTPLLHFCAQNLPAGPWLRRRRGSVPGQRRRGRTDGEPPKGPHAPPAAGFPGSCPCTWCGHVHGARGAPVLPQPPLHCEGPAALCPLLGTGTPAPPARAGPHGSSPNAPATVHLREASSSHWSPRSQWDHPRRARTPCTLRAQPAQLRAPILGHEAAPHFARLTGVPHDLAHRHRRVTAPRSERSLDVSLKTLNNSEQLESALKSGASLF